MSNEVPKLTMEVRNVTPLLGELIITIPASFVDALFHQTLIAQQQHSSAAGFTKGAIPLKYVEQNYRSHILEHVKEFLFNYFVTSFLYRELRNRKIPLAGTPRLSKIELKQKSDARYHFECTLFKPIPLKEWRYFPFKAPKRKNYKDLDKQVEYFIKTEQECLKNHEADKIKIGDWIQFSAQLINEKNKPLLSDDKEELWLKLGREEADGSFHELLLDKKTGDSFATINPCIQSYFSKHIPTQFNFLITINTVLPNTFFCLDLLKKHFCLKTNKELNQKLIEVFSYRNDLSQRRTTVEETLKLMLQKHKFGIPNHLILRKQKEVLSLVHKNPDYQVYRMQNNFKDQIRQLAEKQAKEAILIDYVAQQENIQPTQHDIKCYLNLINRPRTKEFIYFDMPATKIKGQEIPVPEEKLKMYAQREKTLNHIIRHLTRK